MWRVSMTRIPKGVNRTMLRTVLDATTGMLLCTWLAVTAALIAQTWSHPLALLLPFVPAVGFVARMCGILGAILGLVSGAYVFVVALFAPMGRFDIASTDACTALFWMVLCAAVAAFIFERRNYATKGIGDGGKAC
jgi:K+-sensing histidine kinase KdpD